MGAEALDQAQDQKRNSNLELMFNVDAEQLGIPDTDYGTTLKMPSVEFQRICRDLSGIGNTVTPSRSPSRACSSTYKSASNKRQSIQMHELSQAVHRRVDRIELNLYK